jgi:hypothetical protein
MSLKFDLFPIRPLTAARFWSWLARAAPGAALEYHRGLLILDRSPSSELSEDDRRVVARLADAAFQAAEEGRVLLVQRRNDEFDFSYLAIRSVRAANRRTVPVPAIDRAAAQRSTLRSEAA